MNEVDFSIMGFYKNKSNVGANDIDCLTADSDTVGLSWLPAPGSFTSK